MRRGHLRDSILQKKTVSLKAFQKLAGKIMSFTLVVPGARVYTSAIYQAMSKLYGKTRPIPLKGDLLREFQSWEFMDTWKGYLPWRQEYHFQLSLSSDASNTGWGGIINFADQPTETVKGIWDCSEHSSPIVVREAKALFHTLVAAGSRIANSRVDCQIDNQTDTCVESRRI